MLLFSGFGDPATGPAPNPAEVVDTRRGALPTGPGEGYNATTPRGAIPTGPAASYQDVYSDAPTESLRRMARGLALKHKSITAVVTLPGRLNPPATVDVSILFGPSGPRATQTYNNATGNRFITNYPEKLGAQRTEELVISLAEKGADGYTATAQGGHRAAVRHHHQPAHLHPGGGLRRPDHHRHH